MKHVRGGYALKMFDITFTSKCYHWQYMDTVEDFEMAIRVSIIKKRARLYVYVRLGHWGWFLI